MKKMSIIMSLFLVLLFSCKQDDKIPETYKQKFSSNYFEWNELIGALKFDTSLNNKYGETIPATSFKVEIKNKLQKLGVRDVHLFSWGGKQRQFQFLTNWEKTHPIHLYYNSLDTLATAKGYYKKDENNNEVWGLGNSWALILEVKFIEAMI